MSDKVQYHNVGVGFSELLTLLFVGLKLGGVINWSWWWVLSPLWIGFGLAVCVGLFILFVGMLMGMVK